jgi:hypothetical protein
VQVQPDHSLVASIAHELSRKAGICKAQELRSFEWSEIKLCMNLHVLPICYLTIVSSFVSIESYFVMILLNP